MPLKAPSNIPGGGGLFQDGAGRITAETFPGEGDLLSKISGRSRTRTTGEDFPGEGELYRRFSGRGPFTCRGVLIQDGRITGEKVSWRTGSGAENFRIKSCKDYWRNFPGRGGTFSKKSERITAKVSPRGRTFSSGRTTHEGMDQKYYHPDGPAGELLQLLEKCDV